MTTKCFGKKDDVVTVDDDVAEIAREMYPNLPFCELIAMAYKEHADKHEGIVPISPKKV